MIFGNVPASAIRVETSLRVHGMNEQIEWIYRHGSSFGRFIHAKSPYRNSIAFFTFENEADAILFKLKFG